MLEPRALPHGAALFAERVEGARSFAVGFWFPIGSRHEAPRERGFTHFVEHLLFKGTAKRSAMDIARAIDRVGGYINAFTERDLLCVHCTVPASRWELAVEILIDMCFSSKFPGVEVDKEREVIISEILASRDDPEEMAHDLFLERIWPGSPLSRPIAGTSEEVHVAKRDDLWRYYKSNIRPENLVVTVAGPKNENDMATRLGSLLEDGWTADLTDEPSDSSQRPLVEEPRFVPGIGHAVASVSQIYLFMAIPIHPPYDANDYYVLSALNGAIGESMSSRLFQGLREEAGLCYSVYSGFSIGPVEGLWMAQASSSAKSFPALLSALEREIDALSETRALSDEEISESISRLDGGFDLSLDDTEYRMKRLARQAFHANRVLDTEETKSRILEVSNKAIATMTRRVFGSGERALFAYGKLGDKGVRSLRDSRSSQLLGISDLA